MNVSKRMGKGIGFTLMLLALMTTSAVQAAQFQISVVDGNGNPLPADNGFRWVLQEDTTYAIDPANPPPINEQLALNFHKSYHPIAQSQADPSEPLKGNVDGDNVNVIQVPPGRYYLSVLPYKGYAMGGTPVTVLRNAQDPDQVLDNVTVTVHAHPIPTAQIAVYLFEDCYPLNGAPDLPEEEVASVNGDGTTTNACSSVGHAGPDFTKFKVIIEEPGGKYGANGGPLLQNAFGDPLGTSYVQTCDANGQPDAIPATTYGCFDANGAPVVDQLGDGTLTPNPDGTLLVQNLAPGKYGVIITPPTGAGWVQTSTIEGTPVNDAWVKANEPPYFVEFGPPGPHVFFGFTREHNDLAGGSATVTGTITDMHMSRPVDTALYSGRPFPQCWIALNEGAAGPNVYTAPCDADSNFSIPNVPAGSYELKVFDKPLDVVIATYAFTVDPSGTCNGGQSCAFGEVPVFNWNNRMTTYLFNDANQNGIWDPTETNIGAESGPVNMRWRDGTVYQSFPTDFDGLAPFDEAFPWFNWMVAEVGFTNKKATGATVIVDAGGDPSLNPYLAGSPFATDPGVGERSDGSLFSEMLPQDQLGLPTCEPTPPYLLSECSVDGHSRTERGPVLLEAFQGFLGQTNWIFWGKSDYIVNYFGEPGSPLFPPLYVGENGGIAGVVFNTVTRAENDPQLAVGEGWEPGVPRVQVNLYADGDIDSPVLGANEEFPNGRGDIDWNGDGIYQADDDVPDDINGVPGFQRPDTDNYPLGWGNPDCVDNLDTPVNECIRGPEDVDQDDPTHTLATNDAAVFDKGDAIAVVWTDSWDDNTPTGCQGTNNPVGAEIPGVADDRCFDGMRNWNQVRPGVFDGGYAFADYDHVHLQAVNPAVETKIQAFYDYVHAANLPNDAALQLGILPSDYIVEATTPPGFEALQEHHKNVDLGDAYIPSSLQLQALAPSCVGDDHVVPPYFSLSTKDGSGYDIPPGNLTADPLEAAAPFAGDTRKMCDMKKVPLNAAQNAAADFFLVSETPVAANVTGIILNDLANEFNPNSPNFGEKYAPPLVPVAFYDWAGKPVNRVYADEFGAYNAMLPSTWNANLPQPSGMSPSMMIACMNDAGPIPDPANPSQMIVDPFFNPNFSQFCYNFQFMPGSTTYLDTPVLANAAYTSPTTFPVDCEIPDRTPMIAMVERSANSAPSAADGVGGPFVVSGLTEPQEILIHSRGMVTVPNPDWDGTSATPRTIVRNYLFDNSDNVVLLAPDGATETVLNVTTNSTTLIGAEVPTGMIPGDYQVIVRSVLPGIGGQDTVKEAPTGVTLTVGQCQGASSGRRCTGTEVGIRNNGQAYQVINVAADGSGDYTKIQDAIDIADAGDLILIAPGSYDELLVMWKPVKLQGWGADRVVLNARQFPTEKVQAWRTKIDALIASGDIDLLPGQANNVGGFPALGAPAFATAEGAGIFVSGNSTGPNRFSIGRNRGARIDGLTIIGASNGGGIVVNGYAGWMNIGNNVLTTNSGIYGGAIRVGEPDLTVELTDGQGNNYLAYTDAVNDRIRIHHNRIVKNGATEVAGAGAGISLYTGADLYRVTDNWVCGNFSQTNGGGIGHLGLSDRGRIENNDILFNESFSQANAANGGGIYVAGQVPLTVGGLSEGTGNVVINANRIHGNSSGAGDGSGISVVSVNGTDIVNNPADSTQWWDVSIFNNMITNNVAGLAGALTIQDSVEVHVVNNTIAHNDSAATAALAFTPGFPNQSNAQPAGVVSRIHSPALASLLASIDPGSLPLNGGRLDEYLTFSDVNLNNNIVFGNRSFYWANVDVSTTVATETGLFPITCTAPPSGTGCDVATTDIADYSNDLAVLDGSVDTGDTLFTRYNLLTDNANNVAEYGPGNPGGNTMVFTTTPGFLNPVLNEGKNGLDIVEFTVLQTAGAFDEGGNFIQIAFGPLSIVDTGSDATGLTLFDYHIGAGSPAENAGQNVGLGGALGSDYDGDPRTNGNINDIGADER